MSKPISITPLQSPPLDEELPRSSPSSSVQARVEAILETMKESLKQHNYPETFYFWSSQTAFAIYIVISLALLIRRAWVLYAILPIMSGQVAWVISKWTFYILDDAELDRCIRFIQTWLQRILNEGEKMIQNQDAIRMILAASIISNASTGFQYARMVLRVRMSQVNQQYITEMSDRFRSVTLPKLPPAPSVPSLDEVIKNTPAIVDDTSVAKTKTEFVKTKIKQAVSPKGLLRQRHPHRHHHHRHLFGLPFGKGNNSHNSLLDDTDLSDE